MKKAKLCTSIYDQDQFPIDCFSRHAEDILYTCIRESLHLWGIQVDQAAVVKVSTAA